MDELSRKRFMFMEGWVVGSRERKNKNTTITDAATFNKKPIKVAKNATIGITAQTVKLDSRDNQVVTCDIMCTGVNIGVAGFVAKIVWDNYLVYTGVDFGGFGNSISVDDSKALTHNELTVIGQRDSNMELKDFVLFKINFNMINVGNFVDKIYVNCIRSNGQSMVDCSLLTLKDGTYYFITPSESNNGYYYFDSEDKPYIEDASVKMNGPTNYPIGTLTGGGGVGDGGRTTGEYTLGGYLGSATGVGGYIVVEIWSNGMLLGSDRQYVTTGDFNIKGNINIVGKEAGHGDLNIVVKVEPKEEDDDPYYLLIPAFGFNINFKTEVSKGDSVFPKAPLRVRYNDNVEIMDLYSIEIYTQDIDDTDSNMDMVYIEDISAINKMELNIYNKFDTSTVGVEDVYKVDIIVFEEEFSEDTSFNKIDIVDDYKVETVTVEIIDDDSTRISDSVSIGDVYNIEFEEV